MSAAQPPHSPSHSVEPDQYSLSHGSSAHQGQESDTDSVEGYTRDDYDDYIREDLRSRVFVDFEVFMKHVLHVPDDWKTKWGPAVDAVKADRNFEQHLEGYGKHCNDSSALDVSFYDPLVDTANAALDVLSRFNGISLGIPQCCWVNDPKELRGKVFIKTNLFPNMVALYKDCEHPGEESFNWANPLHILEARPFGVALCDGRNMPRLVVNEIDPTSNHAPPPNPVRHRAKEHTPPTASATASGSTSKSSEPRKRPADGSNASNQRPAKKAKTESKASDQMFDDEDEGSVSKPETQRQRDPVTQVCRYLLEMFSTSLLRSHATVGLVDHGRLQLYHASRSVILVSSAINFLEGDGVDKFIAIIIAFYRLSFRQNGILDTFAKDNPEVVKNPRIPEDNTVIQKGNTLEFSGGGLQERFTVELGDVIYRDPATVGRSTAVFSATSDRWKEYKLVVKISWPDSGRVPETKFVKKAKEEAEKTKDKWATNHLPRVFYDKDVVFEKGSTLESVASLFDVATIVNGKYTYERRALRVIVQERLYPLRSLSNVREIGQAFVDIACIHRWLYDVPGILHRDLSPNNTMCRIIEANSAEGKTRNVYGVLTDYDLSSWKEELKTDYTMTSQQRTGTPPYMAHELLMGTSRTHLYRHDIESLFHIMLLMCGRHTIVHSSGQADTGAKSGVVMRKGKLPYQRWFEERDYDALGEHKAAFFTYTKAIELSPAFEDFRAWLQALQYRFSNGFIFRLTDVSRKKQVGSSADGLPPFDDETLGGHINYSSFIEPVGRLTGQLEGLIIRYPSTVNPTSAAPADA